MKAIKEIENERIEQIFKHGKSVEYDVKHNRNGELITAVFSLLGSEGQYPFPYKWDADVCKKMIGKGYRKRLIIVGALIAAEIDRMDYAEPTQTAQTI